MEIQCSVNVLDVFKPRKGLFLFSPAIFIINMIKFRNLLEQLIEDLSPLSGHMGVRWDADLLSYVDIDNPRLADGLVSFLEENDIKYDQSSSVPTPDDYIGNWIEQYVPRQYIPEVLYFCLTRFPDMMELKNPSFAKNGNYRFMLFDHEGEGMMDLVFVDDGAGQALGVLKVDYADELRHFTPHFRKRPVQVHLSKMIPSARGTGEGHQMYSLLLNKFGTIMSDSTLFQGSFAMWDSVIRQSAPYSGVTAFADRLVYANKKQDVYTMSLPNEVLDRFWASKTIQPWVLKMSNALSSLNAKTTAIIELDTSKSVEAVLDFIDNESEGFGIKDLIKLIDNESIGMSDAGGTFGYSDFITPMGKTISKPEVLLLVLTNQEKMKGLIKVEQKGSNLKASLL